MGFFQKVYIKFFIKTSFAYARHLKKKGFLQSQGENCYIAKSANIPDPYLVTIGNNVWITAGCHILGHDASVIMINVMKKRHFDGVGSIMIGDNCFLGNNVIILPGTKIGSNTIVGAGSLVTKDIPDGSVWAGNPARHICSLEDYIEKIKIKTNSYPWKHLLKIHEKHVFDPVQEKMLRAERIKYFFSDSERNS